MKRWALAFLTLALSACTSIETSQLDPAQNLRLPNDVQGNIVFPEHVVLVDRRQRDTTYYKALSSETLNDWGSEMITGLAANEVCVHGLGDEDHYPYTVVSIEKAYVKHLATNISGVVVIAVEAPQQAPVYFRGQSVDVNWWGNDSEFTAVLNQAFTDVLQQWGKVSEGGGSLN
ncbi:MAG: hypothetical protein P8O79_09675 [Halieaceae bacterium]|nr:hypothetical protein [Halieaceae bacterium]